MSYASKLTGGTAASTAAATAPAAASSKPREEPQRQLQQQTAPVATARKNEYQKKNFPPKQLSLY